MQMAPWHAAIGLCAMLSTSPALAQDAEPSGVVAVLPATLEGEATPDLQPEVESAVVEGLQRGRFGVIPPPDVTASHPDAAACSDAACATTIATSLQAAYALRTRVTASARNYDIELVLIDAATGEVVTTNRETCEICGMSEVGELAADQAAALRTKVEMLERGPGQLRIISEPEGAEVTIDGAVVGKTPLDVEVEAGKHIIGVRKEGHGTVEREVESATGVTETVSFGLALIEKDKKMGLKPMIGWIGLGVGVASLATGAALIAVDERPYRRDCSGNNVDMNGTCRFRMNTLAGGITGVVVGVGLIATGITLVVMDRMGQKKKGSNVRAGIGPGSVALIGRF